MRPGGGRGATGGSSQRGPRAGVVETLNPPGTPPRSPSRRATLLVGPESRPGGGAVNLPAVLRASSAPCPRPGPVSRAALPPAPHRLPPGVPLRPPPCFALAPLPVPHPPRGAPAAARPERATLPAAASGPPAAP